MSFWTHGTKQVTNEALQTQVLYFYMNVQQSMHVFDYYTKELK